MSATFGDLLRRYRLAAGLTQEELAARAQVSPRAISDLERGTRTHPWRDTVRLLVSALELPSAERAELEKAARRGSLPTADSADHRPAAVEATIRTNLPIESTSFVGREREITELRQRLVGVPSAPRLLTLTGTGGCGKTRLALQVAASLVPEYPDGVWLVGFAPLGDPALVDRAVAAALGVRELASEPIRSTLVSFLRGRQLLLVLDNCEHLIDACSLLADWVLQTCPRVRILATSREMLGVPGELTFRVPSLVVPDPETGPSLDDVRRSEAIRLFVDRAQGVAAEFAVTGENAAALITVCRRLDGIPLAIELAAARMRILTVEQIAARLDDRFRLLTGGSRTALQRQQTLRALIDWSHDLLSDGERILFRRLAVFAGGWTLDAAEAVCGEDENSGEQVEKPIARSDVLDLLTGLADKSLVVVDGQRDERRYHFLETIRAYAGEKLVEAGDPQRQRDQHVAWCLALGKRAEPELFGPASIKWLERLEADYANLRVALEYCLESNPETGLRLAGSLWSFWFLRGDRGEGQRWLAAMLNRASAVSAARGQALLGASFCFRMMSTLRQARLYAEESLAFARATADRRLAAWALHNLGEILTMAHDRVGARSALEESIALCRQVADRVGEGMGLRDLAHVVRLDSDYERASALYQDSLAILRAVGHPLNIRWTLWGIGYLARVQQEPERARAAFLEAVTTAREDRDEYFLAQTLRGLGELERSAGHFGLAESYLKEGLAILEKIGRTMHAALSLYSLATLLLRRGAYARGVRLAATAPREVLDPVNTLPEDVAAHEAALETAREALGEVAFVALWNDGLAMTPERAVARALEAEADVRG
jgi:non-specific serine/threonine protein kinase